MKHADSDLEIDLFGDFMTHVRGDLTQRGHAAPSDDEQALFAFFNLQRRLIPPLKRRVHEALGMSCAQPLQAGYDEIKRKTLAGEDLAPHLSTRVQNADLDTEKAKRRALDGLLDDWGIHHLHLGTADRGDGFVDRHDEVLFARFLENDAYFVGIWKHGEWGEVAVLEELQRNWPHLIRQVDAIPARGQNPSNEEIVRARAAGVQALIAVGGKFVMPMGGAITTAKIGVDVVRLADRAREQLAMFQRLAIEQKDSLLAHAVSRGYAPRPLKLRLQFDAAQAAYAGTEDGACGVRFGKFL